MKTQPVVVPSVMPEVTAGIIEDLLFAFDFQAIDTKSLQFDFNPENLYKIFVPAKKPFESHGKKSVYYIVKLKGTLLVTKHNLSAITATFIKGMSGGFVSQHPGTFCGIVSGL
jgi:hypothetical protein